MSEEALDLLAANFIVFRKQGTYSQGTVRIYLYNPIAFSLTKGTKFAAANGRAEFYLEEDIYFPASLISLNMEGYYYFVDVQVKATEAGKEYNVPAETKMTFVDYNNSNVAQIKALSNFIGGTDKESNEEFYHRIKDAIAKRDLICARGAKTILEEEFDYIKRLTIIGKDDIEMERDWVYGVHVGGKIDYYITTAIENAYSFVMIQDLPSILNISKRGQIPLVPCLRIKSIELVDAVSGQPLNTFIPEDDYSIWVNSSDYSTLWYRYSAKEDVKLKIINTAWLHEAVKINVQWNPNVTDVQNYVSNPDNRTINADPIVYNHVPVFVSFALNYVQGPTTEEAKAKIYEYLLKPLSVDLENRPQLNIKSNQSIYIKVADIIDILYDLGAVHVDLPITIIAKVQHKNGEKETWVSDDIIEIPRTYAFYPDNIELTRRESI